MKKILSILTSLSLVTAVSTSAVSCTTKESNFFLSIEDIKKELGGGLYKIKSLTDFQTKLDKIKSFKIKNIKASFLGGSTTDVIISFEPKNFYKLESNYLIIKDGVHKPFAGNSEDYLEDRSNSELKGQIELESQINNLKINTKKKLVMLGLDGIEWDVFNNNIGNENKNINFKVQYNIQSYESLMGWRSNFYGNIFRKNKSILRLIRDAKNGAEAKISFSSQWSSLTNDVFKDFNLKEEADNFIEPLKNLDIDFAKPDINQIIGVSDFTFNNATEKYNENYNFIFQYDTMQDDLNHGGFNYKTREVKEIQKKYKEYFSWWEKNTYDENTLFIVTTDHGRNPDNLNHTKWYPTAHMGWVVANKDLNKILGRQFIRHYDLKETILKWMTT